ncbi:Telomerase reverse transcriptase [Melia azedarach]|uniref:Telomerase reverse transcriptase n=1 Tax=Melia azedarach TaxID=155640 RepID=A0ACC1XG41_MELAZ|nr:Telomerase reverse transcriptase [Melia azedarach]
MGKKRRVPEVLWRLFRNRARSLAHTIMSLITQSPPSKCRCKGCLVCVSTENDMSFLIQPDDPSDYRNLLHQCFVVVNDNAPPLSDLSLDNRWPQLQIVQRTIEMIISEQPVSSNTICSGYDKGKRSSLIVELLTDSSWSLLLKRVGDDVMIYLLKYSSIFLPLPYKKHHQVAGPPY